MQHRHLQSEFSLSAAAIDDIINRGGREDWAFLRDSSQNDSSVMAKIRRVCAPHNSDPYDQKYHLWALYAGLEFRSCSPIGDSPHSQSIMVRTKSRNSKDNSPRKNLIN